jgi:carboxymethylenebutenolidase
MLSFVGSSGPPARGDGAGAGVSDVVVSTVSFESQGKAISVERFEPKRPGTYPAVLVVHGAGGTTIGGHWFRQTARELAARGYVAHVVHYFDLSGTKVADIPTMRTNFPVWLRVIADGITDVSKRPNVDPARVGLVGFSLGSYLSNSLALFDPRVGAVVEFFGGLPDELAGVAKTLPPTLILHGDADLVVPVSEAKELEAICKERKAPHEVQIYRGQGHGFVGDPDTDSVNRTAAFLDAHLKNASPPLARRETAAVPTVGLFATNREKSGGGK